MGFCEGSGVGSNVLPTIIYDDNCPPNIIYLIKKETLYGHVEFTPDVIHTMCKHRAAYVKQGHDD
mgnify:CR=1 FL=1